MYLLGVRMKLGYTSPGTQPTPRRESSLKSEIVAVSVANKHTTVGFEFGEVFTMGCDHKGVCMGSSACSIKKCCYIPAFKESWKCDFEFSSKEHHRLTAIAAGIVYSLALAESGALFYWLSPDCNLRCQQVKKQQSSSHSPKARASGFSVATGGSILNTLNPD